MQSITYFKGANNQQQARKKINPYSLWASTGLHAEEGEEEAVMSSITYERKAKGKMRMVAKIAEVLEGA